MYYERMNVVKKRFEEIRRMPEIKTWTYKKGGWEWKKAGTIKKSWFWINKSERKCRLCEIKKDRLGTHDKIMRGGKRYWYGKSTDNEEKEKWMNMN